MSSINDLVYTTYDNADEKFITLVNNLQKSVLIEHILSSFSPSINVDGLLGNIKNGGSIDDLLKELTKYKKELDVMVAIINSINNSKTLNIDKIDNDLKNAGLSVSEN